MLYGLPPLFFLLELIRYLGRSLTITNRRVISRRGLIWRRATAIPISNVDFAAMAPDGERWSEFKTLDGEQIDIMDLGGDISEFHRSLLEAGGRSPPSAPPPVGSVKTVLVLAPIWIGFYSPIPLSAVLLRIFEVPEGTYGGIVLLVGAFVGLPLLMIIGIYVGCQLHIALLAALLSDDDAQAFLAARRWRRFGAGCWLCQSTRSWFRRH